MTNVGVTSLSWTPALMARVKPPCPTILGMAAAAPLLPGDIWSFASLLNPKPAGQAWCVDSRNDTNTREKD